MERVLLSAHPPVHKVHMRWAQFQGPSSESRVPRPGPECAQPIEEQLKMRLNLLLAWKSCVKLKQLKNWALTETETTSRPSPQTDQKG